MNGPIPLVGEDSGQRWTVLPEDFVAAGGEGRVFAQGDQAFKLMHDPSHTLSIARLNAARDLTVSATLRPQERLLDDTGTPVGHALPFLPRARSLAALIPPGVRPRLGLDPAAIARLLAQLTTAVHQCHAAGGVIADLSAFNALVQDPGPSGGRLHLIDVESWGLPGFSPTAAPAGLIDPLRPPGQWTPASDWFAYATVAVQLLLGVHPYGGKLPGCVGLANRVAAGVSVFAKQVTLPPAALALSTVPTDWRDWAIGIFAHQHRQPPPPWSTPAAAPADTLWSGSRPQSHGISDAQLTSLHHAESPILQVLEDGGPVCVVTHQGVFLGAQRVCELPTSPWAIALTPRTRQPVLCTIRDGALSLRALVGDRPVHTTLAADDLVGSDGVVHIRLAGALLRLHLHEVGAHTVLASTDAVARVLPLATRLFDGVATQDVHGACWLNLIGATTGSPQVRLPALDGHQILAARARAGVAHLLTQHKGQFAWHQLRVDGPQHDLHSHPIQDPDLPELAVLPGHRAVRRLGDQLTLFDARPGSPRTHTMRLPIAHGQLCSSGGELRLVHDRDVYRVSA